MIRKLSALGLSLAASTAFAQSASSPPGASVSVYGLVDVGVEMLTDVGAVRAHLVRMPGLTGELPSRLGFRGKEDLSDGVSAVFALEAGFGADTGTSNQGGRFLGRQAWAGLSGPWGVLTAGRNYTMLYWALLDGDLLGPDAFGLGSIDNYIPNTRIDNSVAWRGTFSGFTLGATYSLGRDSVNAGPSPSGANCPGESATDRQACRELSGLVKYDAAAWGVALGLDKFRGGAGAYANLTKSSLTDTRMTLNGYVKVSPALKLVAGVMARDNDGAAAASATNGATSRSNLYWIGGAWSAADQLVIDGQVHRISFKHGGDSSTLVALRSSYSLSRRTVVYAQAGRIENGSRLAFSVSNAAAGGQPPAGGSQTGTMVGMRTSF